MNRVRRQIALLTMSLLMWAPTVVAQQSAREARKAGEHAQKEAMKRAKRAQKEARHREKEVRKQIKERDSERTAETKHILKERKRERKEMAERRPTTKSPFEVDDLAPSGKDGKREKSEIRVKERGVDASSNVPSNP